MRICARSARVCYWFKFLREKEIPHGFNVFQLESPPDGNFYLHRQVDNFYIHNFDQLQQFKFYVIIFCNDLFRKIF